MVQGAALVMGLMFVLLNLGVDLLCRLLDPRQQRLDDDDALDEVDRLEAEVGDDRNGGVAQPVPNGYGTWREMALPSLTLALGLAAVSSRVARDAVAEVDARIGEQRLDDDDALDEVDRLEAEVGDDRNGGVPCRAASRATPSRRSGPRPTTASPG
jgi:uncharacterized membrane-anchored protein